MQEGPMVSCAYVCHSLGLSILTGFLVTACTYTTDHSRGMLHHVRCPDETAKMASMKQERVRGTGAVMDDCATCKSIRWSASIPLILLLGAGGFVVFAQLAEARDNAPAMILGLFLATWSYVLSVAGTVLLASWWFWKWHHMRTAHTLRPC